jgi:hypothetical protein
MRKREIQGDGRNPHEKLGPGEFRLRVNLPSPIRQVAVPIWWLTTRIQDLPNPIRQFVPLVSHIRLDSIYCSHLYPPSRFVVHNSSIIAESKVMSYLSISPFHDHELTLCTAYTKYSIHQVQHTPSTAYTEYIIHPVQHTPSTAYTKYSIHQVQNTPSTAYTKCNIHRVQNTPNKAHTQDYLCSHHSHHCELTPECSFSFRGTSIQDQPPTASCR